LGSEALFLYDISIGLAPIILLFVATLGNTLGGVVNYWLGFKGEELLLEKGLIKKERLDKAMIFFNKYGGYSLLFSWVPIIGDPITFVAGILKYDIKKFLFLVALVKFGRYLFLLVVYIYFNQNVL
jgi:membrane protein YqaA with SNARE-associated domain